MGGKTGCTITFGGISFGMSPNQVLHLVGEPTAKEGRCWKYALKVDAFLASQGVVESDEAVCFFAGQISDMTNENYIRKNGKLVLWHAPPPKLP